MLFKNVNLHYKCTTTAFSSILTVIDVNKGDLILICNNGLFIVSVTEKVEEID